MPTVTFGNSSPIDTEKIDESKDGDISNLKRKDIAYEKSVTVFEVPGGTKAPGALAAITAVWWKNHSNDPPEWVESNNKALESYCADYFSWTKEEGPPDDQGDFVDLMPSEHECLIGKPEGWVVKRKEIDRQINEYDELAPGVNTVVGQKVEGTKGGGIAWGEESISDTPTSILEKPQEEFNRLATIQDLARLEKMRWPELFMDAVSSHDPLLLKTTNGIDHAARVLGGDRFGETGTATGSSATSLTNSGASFPASSGGPPENGGYVGHIVLADASPQVYGIIIANSGTVLTIDYWHSPATPGAQASTPGTTAKYTVLPGGAGAFWMGFSVSSDTADVADTFLDNGGSISEIFGTFNTGLSRQPVTYAHTLGASTYTLSKEYTAIGADGASNTITKIGIFANGVLTTPSASNSGVLLFTTDLTNTATLISGDKITPTDTITLS